jgi:CrcB protein
MPPRLLNDPDADTRPLRFDRNHALLVGVGGAIGTTIRLLLTTWLPADHGIPVIVFVINITGAFLLGALLESLARTGPDTGNRRALRLFAGTGIIGGYTTYSTLAVGAAELLNTGRLLTAAGYGIATVLIGAAATLLGILLARAITRAEATR